MNSNTNNLRIIRIALLVFITGLLVSGITAFPLTAEINWLLHLGNHTPLLGGYSGLYAWLQRIADGLNATQATYPFIFYGTDWLAFAHIIIAIAFIGPYRDPVRNSWVITWGMIACIGIIPLALIAGGIRGIPLGWQFIDMSFGVFGIIPLLVVRRYTKKLITIGLFENTL